MNCRTTHHVACDCREQKVAVLIKAALDAACELDGLQAACPDMDQESHDAYRQSSERVYDACEQLGVDPVTGSAIGVATEEHF